MSFLVYLPLKHFFKEMSVHIFGYFVAGWLSCRAMSASSHGSFINFLTAYWWFGVATPALSTELTLQTPQAPPKPWHELPGTCALPCPTATMHSIIISILHAKEPLSVISFPRCHLRKKNEYNKNYSLLNKIIKMFECSLGSIWCNVDIKYASGNVTQTSWHVNLESGKWSGWAEFVGQSRKLWE